MKRSSWWLWLVLVVLVALFSQRGHISQTATASANPADSSDDGTAAFANAYAKHLSHIQLQGSGMVTKVLPDDTEGLRHQRLIVQLGGDRGQVILIAHDIDIAPRVDGIRAGDTLAFNGEYIWTERGGVLHWTHHDPQHRHPDGWLRFNGRTYQ